MKIFVNGTFDILHRGHLELLNYAKGLGDFLLVGIDSDERVKEKKGSTRPIHKQEERKFFLENLKAVIAVWIFDSQEELAHICKIYRPHLMVKGSDYYGKKITGSEYCDEIKYFKLVKNYSTSKIIENINNRK